MAQIIKFPKVYNESEDKEWRSCCKVYSIQINPYSFRYEITYLTYCQMICDMLATYKKGLISSYKVPGPYSKSPETHWRVSCERLCISISPYSFQSKSEYEKFCKSIDSKLDELHGKLTI